MEGKNVLKLVAGTLIVMVVAGMAAWTISSYVIQQSYDDASKIVLESREWQEKYNMSQADNAGLQVENEELQEGLKKFSESEISEIRVVSEEEQKTVTITEDVEGALDIISVRKYYDMDREMNDGLYYNSAVYEITLHNVGNKKIYFYPEVYAKQQSGASMSSGHIRARVMDAGEIGTLSIWWIPIDDNPYSRITIATRMTIEWYGAEETEIFSLDTEKLQPPEWLWEA